MSVLQAPRAVVMIRPQHFVPNPETAADNGFQTRSDESDTAISARALAEFDAAVAALRAVGVTVHPFEDDGQRDTPDAVFPNNWFSTHAGGHIALYPMCAPSRRRERRWDIIEYLKTHYRVQDVIDYSGLEMDDLALEGTGAMVLDHLERVAYTVRSNRADPVILERFCTNFNYEPMVFDAADMHGQPVYHTNVLMSVCTDFALICLDMIRDAARRGDIRARLEESGRVVIPLDAAQISAFAGNAFELTGTAGRVLALSTTAAAALSDAQKAQIAQSATLLPLAIPTIEQAGGSVRCMLAGIHLSRRPSL